MSGGIIIKFGLVVVWREISSLNASGPSHIYTQSYHKFGWDTLLAENERKRGKRGRSYHQTIKYLSPGGGRLFVDINYQLLHSLWNGTVQGFSLQISYTK